MRQEADSRDGVMQRNEGFVIYKENKMVEKRRNECCEGGGVNRDKLKQVGRYSI